MVAVGDTLPDLMLPNIVNGSKDSMRLSEIKGKLVILDLWNTHCGACIAAFPHLYDLQQQLGDSLTVMPVCMLDSKADVQQFYDKRKGTANALKFSTAVLEDTLDALYTLFHPDSYPHEVWLDEHRVVRAITYAADVSADNIRALLNYQKDVAVKRKQVLYTGNDRNFLYGSVLTRYNDSLYTYGVQQKRDSLATRVYGMNLPVLEYLLNCYPQFRNDIHHKQLVIKGGDPANYYFNRPTGMDAAAYRQKILYGYDLSLPPRYSPEEADSIMRTDICRFFRLSVYTQKIKEVCLVLYSTGNITSSSAAQELEVSDDRSTLLMRNTGIIGLMGFLDKKGWPVVINETGYTGTMDLDLVVSPKLNPAAVNAALKPYRLAVKAEARTIEKLVIEQH